MQALILANKLALEDNQSTYPVKVTSLFLAHLFDINMNFKSRMKFSFRVGGTLRLKDHVTQADLQLLFILFRCCNAYGYIELSNRKAIYRQLEREFEVPISESQFYASLEKFIHHKLIVSEVAVDGSIRHKLNYFMNEKTGKIGHYVLFHPFVFTKTFHQLTLAEKKLIISAYAQTSGNPNKVISRNLKQHNGNFKHAQYAGLLEFLHKTQKSHIKEVLNNLKLLTLPIETQKKGALFADVKLLKGKSGFKAQLKFNRDFLISVAEEEPQKYYRPLDACTLYPKFYALLKREAAYYGIGEVLSDRSDANRLVKILQHVNIRLIRHAFYKLSSYVNLKGLPRKPEFIIKESIETKFNEILDQIITKTGAEEFIRWPETKKEGIKERRWRFSHAASKSKLGIRKLRTRLLDAVKNLSLSYPILPWQISDYGGGENTYQNSELRKYINIDSIKEKALKLKVDPYYYGDLEYNAFLAIRTEDPRSVEEWMHGELHRLPLLPGKRLIPYNFRLENFLFNE
ncbi:hypothetical protein IAQ67_14575 [Paenibacillus peoriae]|uniref:Uncharacterized protein n=1 Tax=Paenibacillus peoriae TaxID=59893 RepID=A0A7H0Y233_9BACL|nr:hypothetical protein [Paenibacillus peoriae]QNR65141.1 hypothetical protein IAQ67_14575 [Paenibacillus peoriae]